MSRRSGAAATALILAALAGCGDDGKDTAAGQSAAAGTSVAGYLLSEPTQPTRLCETLAESHPPQCSGASTVIAGLDLSEVNELESAGEVRWTTAPISLLGDLEDGVLSVPVSVAGPAIIGRAVAGPTCPVETSPPDPDCAPRSVVDATIVVRSADGDVVGTVATDATGRFALVVSAGVFTVEPSAVKGLMGQASTLTVTVDATPVTVEIAYDTGIR